jgi:hypothetical protein
MWKRGMRVASAFVVFLLALHLIPNAWCARKAHAWLDGDAETRSRLATSVERWTAQPLDEGAFTTGSERFDSEWLFGTYMMAAMGFGQLAKQEPAQRERYLAAMDRALERLQEPALRNFDSQAWGHDAFSAAGRRSDHAAYRGYFNLALSLRRSIDAEGPHAALNDELSELLLDRLRATPTTSLETYPGEVYPVDNAAVVASVALHARATGRQQDPVVARWRELMRGALRDPNTGLLHQRIALGSHEPVDAPRGSGSALAAYFVSFFDHQLSRDLTDAIERELADTTLGFGAVFEYPSGLRHRQGDIDSGPLIGGYSISATGFSLAAARIHHRRTWFRKLYATTHLFGAPLEGFVSGGPLGDAILLAMLTAAPQPAMERDR